MKITEIINKSEELLFPFEYDTQLIFKKYKELNNVVAFLITERYCFILIKGKLKFFAFKIHMDTKIVHRERKLYELINKKYIVIRNKKLLGDLKKTLIIEGLNPK